MNSLQTMIYFLDKLQAIMLPLAQTDTQTSKDSTMRSLDTASIYSYYQLVERLSPTQFQFLRDNPDSTYSFNPDTKVLSVTIDDVVWTANLSGEITEA